MLIEPKDLFVDFETYCKTCKYSELNENKDPCDECLAIPVNENSQKPVSWKAKE